ncbi:hypothetical protein GCK72_022433 [Caenorhabditis remanei]|uniref:Uncharacterized protein n=1 Tax=Caenorhabditis remanei TaxID=31234 RepID=A0A6A5FTV8_CAERE|nr:hypothetical protein GCK72_022433 [Caenorhabditis remanei]KAF1745983.1 hypothetical protein GCK72_022433 [Caenorhabditis remanei]
MTHQFQIHGKDTFWIDLAPPTSDPMEQEEVRRYSHETLGDKHSFLEKCEERNWEFSIFQRSQFAIMGIIEEINRFIKTRWPTFIIIARIVLLLTHIIIPWYWVYDHSKKHSSLNHRYPLYKSRSPTTWY